MLFLGKQAIALSRFAFLPGKKKIFRFDLPFLPGIFAARRRLVAKILGRNETLAVQIARFPKIHATVAVLIASFSKIDPTVAV